MRTMSRLVMRSLVVVAVTALAAVGPVNAAVFCHKINAKGVGQDHGQGETSAQIIGDRLLQGTTQGTFVAGVGSPAVPIDGTVVFTTPEATLTVTVVGTFNGETGDFSSTGPVTAATGKLAGAVGTLVLEGVEDLSTGKFLEIVTGLICVDLGS